MGRALKNSGISFTQEELDEVAQTYAVLRDALEQAAVKLNLKETEPDYISNSVPA